MAVAIARAIIFVMTLQPFQHTGSTALHALGLPPLLAQAVPNATAVVHRYRSDGHVLLPALFTATELNAFKDTIDKITYADGVGGLIGAPAKPFHHLDHLRLRSKSISALVSSPRLRAVAAALLGAPDDSSSSLCVWLDEAFFKEPGDAMTTWHRDRCAIFSHTWQWHSMITHANRVSASNISSNNCYCPMNVARDSRPLPNHRSAGWTGHADTAGVSAWIPLAAVAENSGRMRCGALSCSNVVAARK